MKSAEDLLTDPLVKQRASEQDVVKFIEYVQQDARAELLERIRELEDSQVGHYKSGLVEGLSRFAWWKDGVQYVGTCGTTLKDAIRDL